MISYYEARMKRATETFKLQQRVQKIAANHDLKVYIAHADIRMHDLEYDVLVVFPNEKTWFAAVSADQLSKPHKIIESALKSMADYSKQN